MKKILCLLLALLVLSAMSACGGQSQEGTNELPPEPTVSQPAEPSASPQPAEAGEPSQKNNILIAYFSLWDNAPWEEGIGSADAVTEWLNGLGLSNAKSETAIRITIGEQELEGILYDSSMARQFIAQLPQTITMSNYGGREVYASTKQSPWRARASSALTMATSLTAPATTPPLSFTASPAAPT